MCAYFMRPMSAHNVMCTRTRVRVCLTCTHSKVRNSIIDTHRFDVDCVFHNSIILELFYILCMMMVNVLLPKYTIVQFSANEAIFHNDFIWNLRVKESTCRRLCGLRIDAFLFNLPSGVRINHFKIRIKYWLFEICRTRSSNNAHLYV